MSNGRRDQTQLSTSLTRRFRNRFQSGLTYTLMAVCFGALWFYAAKDRRLLTDDADARAVSGISRSYAPGSVAYAVATLSSLISADLAVVLYAAIALFYALESSLFGRE